MYVIGIVGWKNSGKTTLVEKLILRLRELGLSVSTVKHTHHVVDVDEPGKDSYRHREAGAREVAIVSSARWALLHENRESEETILDEIIARMTPVDIVLVEGFKLLPHDKIEVHRVEAGGDLIAAGDRTIKAIATNASPPHVSIPCFNLDDVKGIVRFIAQRGGVDAGL